MPRLVIEYVSPRDAPNVPLRLVEVEGDWEEPFFRAVERAVGPTAGTWQVYLSAVGELEARWLRVDESVTVRQVASATDGRVLPVDTGGRGGGEPGRLESAGVGELVPLLKYIKPIRLVLEASKYSRTRSLARDWMDLGGGPPSMELLQAVSEQREWLRGTFDVTFGLDAEPGGRLLREVGYRKVNSQPDTWVDQREL